MMYRCFRREKQPRKAEHTGRTANRSSQEADIALIGPVRESAAYKSAKGRELESSVAQARKMRAQ